MKKLFATLLLVTSGICYATDVPITLFCDSADKIIKGISSGYGESPIAIMKNPRGKTNTIIFVNDATMSWTIIEVVTENNMACVLSSGVGMLQKKTENRPLTFY